MKLDLDELERLAKAATPAYCPYSADAAFAVAVCWCSRSGLFIVITDTGETRILNTVTGKAQ